MAYTSSNVAHTLGELLTHTDLNRIEANVEDAAKRRYSTYNNPNLTLGLSNGGTFVVQLLQGFTTNTGRVRLTAKVTLQGTGGAPARWEYTFLRDGVAVTGDAVNGISSISTVSGEWYELTMDWIVTGLTPSTVWYEWAVAQYRASGAGTASLRKYTFTVEEF